VTTQELLAILNDDAARLGIRPVEARMLRFWIDRHLIEARTPHGRTRGVNPTWHFSESAIQHARAIVELKSRGVQRAASLRIHLWVLHDDYPTEGIREALTAEFARFLKRQRRASRFDYDHRDRKPPTDIEIQKHAKRLPALDDDLRSDGFGFLRPEMLIELVSELTWGEASGGKFAEAPQKLAKLTGLAFDGAKRNINIANIGGLFGNSEETSDSGEDVLKLISRDHLHEARRRFKTMKLFYEVSFRQYPNVGSLRKVHQALAETNWIVSCLAMFAVQVFREELQK
jgi:hypothetical protein